MATGTTLEKVSVVVPGTSNPNTVACIRSLGAVGIHTVVVSNRNVLPARYSSYCDEFIVVPDPGEDLIAYKNALVDISSREDVSTIVPTREEDIYVLVRYRDEFDECVSLVIPSLATLSRAHDRIQLVDAAEAAGVPVPETRLLGDVDDWSQELLVKSRYNLLADTYVDSIAPDEFRTVGTIEHLTPGKEPDITALRKEMHHDPIVQDYVPHDEEYMVGALYDHGKPLALFQHRQIRGSDYRGSGGVYRESVSIPELETVARTLLDHLEWHGLACLEYMKEAGTGEFKLAEINPRMWQSLSATVQMGADFPLYYWLQATGQTDAIDPGYNVGVGCHWLKGELFHAFSLFRYDSPLVDRPGRIATLWDIATSCVKQPHFDYLTLDDLGPFIQDWWELLDIIPVEVPREFPGGRFFTKDRSRTTDQQARSTASLESEHRDELDLTS